MIEARRMGRDIADVVCAASMTLICVSTATNVALTSDRMLPLVNRLIEITMLAGAIRSTAAGASGGRLGRRPRLELQCRGATAAAENALRDENTHPLATVYSGSSIRGNQSTDPSHHAPLTCAVPVMVPSNVERQATAMRALHRVR